MENNRFFYNVHQWECTVTITVQWECTVIEFEWISEYVDYFKFVYCKSIYYNC